MLVEGSRLFLAQGYTATSVDAICAAAGVTKGAFFHHFNSKDDFAASLLAFIWQPVVEEHEQIAAASDADERLIGHVRFMAEWICDVGRLMPLLAQELGAANPEIRAQVGGYFASWMTYLEDYLRAAARQAGAKVDIEALKEFIVATTEGIPVVRSQFGPQALSNVADHLVAAIMNTIDTEPNHL